MGSADTVAAIATPPGRGGIGIVRVSGPGVGRIMRQVAGGDLAPRRALRRTFHDASGAAVDDGLAVYFPAPGSYTGEDVLELQGHGGPAVLRLVLQACLDAGARIAEPGEFTRRAFLNDRLDLAQAEAVADLIDARTGAAARGALRSLQGEFSAEATARGAELTEIRAYVEACLDFPEEEVDSLERAGIGKRLLSLQASLDGLLVKARQGNLLRDGVGVVIAGRPNVGKSSLLNRLAGDELAIVTDIPGTTRDPVRHGFEIDGVPINIVDTAGLRDAADPVERIGVARSWNEIDRADLLLLVVDAAVGEGDEERAIRARMPRELPCIVVHNKIDLLAEGGGHLPESPDRVSVSARTGTGLDALRRAIVRSAGWEGAGEGLYLARERHLRALLAARDHVAAAGAKGLAPELLAEELRLAQDAIASITGEVTPDDLLGEIFSRFCIGK